VIVVGWDVASGTMNSGHHSVVAVGSDGMADYCLGPTSPLELALIVGLYTKE